MSRLTRVSATTLSLENEYGIPVRVYANEDMKIDTAAVDELSGLLGLAGTVEQVNRVDPAYFGAGDAGILDLAVTPDFHKGKGIPIGTVMLTRGFLVPQAIGNDVNCGMRLHVTELSERQIRNALPQLEKRIRHLFFEGGRQIPMCRTQREGLLKEGLIGLLETHRLSRNEGLWASYRPDEQERDLDRVVGAGSVSAEDISPLLDDYLGSAEPTYDDQIGSIGGGNHFVEIQVVHRVFDGQTAHAWELRPGRVAVMIHTGCVRIGYPTGMKSLDVVREIYPPSLRQPPNGIFPLPDSERFAGQRAAFWTCYANAANFAFGNRLFLSLMIRQALTEVVGDTPFRLLYDAGHNVISVEEIDGQRAYLHRKGATPARGFREMEKTEFAFYGEPVLIPGSMGASSFLAAGLGNADSLWSASHGAGRSLSRGQALKADDRLFREFLERFRIVTPIDPQRPDVKSRRDILRKWEEELKKEAPYAYKDIGAVIETQIAAGTVRNVAELRPILTVKG